MSTFPSDRQLNELRDAEARLRAQESQLNLTLAQTKALRMQVRTLIEDRERSLSISVDTVMASIMEPDEMDFWEIDESRFGETLRYRIEGAS